MILSGREHLGRFCIGNLQAGDSMVENLIRVGLGCVWQVVGGEETVEKPPFLEECRCTSEANEKMVLKPLSNSSYTP